MRWKHWRRWAWSIGVIVIVLGGLWIWAAWRVSGMVLNLYDGEQVSHFQQQITEFVDGDQVYELTVTPFYPSLPIEGGGPQLDLSNREVIVMVTPRGKREPLFSQLSVKCNGKVFAEKLPNVDMKVDFTSVGLNVAGGGAECRDTAVVILMPSRRDAGWGYGPFYIDSDATEAIPSNFNAGERSLPARRIRVRFTALGDDVAADLTIDIRLADDRLQSVAFDCGKPMPPIHVDRPAPKGAFAAEITLDGTQHDGVCGFTSVELLGSDPKDTRVYNFAAGSRLVSVRNPRSRLYRMIHLESIVR